MESSLDPVSVAAAGDSPSQLRGPFLGEVGRPFVVAVHPFAVAVHPFEAFRVEVVHPFGETYQAVEAFPAIVAFLAVEAFQDEEDHCSFDSFEECLVVVAFPAVGAFPVEEGHYSFEGHQDPCWDLEAFQASGAVQA